MSRAHPTVIAPRSHPAVDWKRWRLLLDDDYALLPTQNLLTGADGDKTIAGRTWNLLRSSALTRCEIVNGTGMVWDHGTTNTAHNADDGSDPQLALRVTELGSELDGEQFEFLLKVYATHNGDAATEQWGCAISNYVNRCRFGVGGMIGHDGTNEVFRTVAHQNTGAFSSTTAAGQNIIAVRASGWLGGWTWHGQWSNGFPRTKDLTFHTRCSSAYLPGFGGSYGSTDLGIHLFMQSGNTAGNFSVTIKRVQLWVARVGDTQRLP